MKKYGVLIKPSFNKVFFESSKKLMINEIKILDQMVLNQNYRDFQLEKIGGVDYITFVTDEEIGDKELKYFSRLSSLYSLFEILPTQEVTLRPLVIDEEKYFDDDIISILKYTGKTNEDFTKMMLNIAIFCSDYAPNFTQRLPILDPVAGRGTTLFQGLIYGYNVYGVEASKKSTHAMMTFLKRYLIEKHYKHKLEQSKVRRKGRIVGKRFTFEAAPTKEDYKNNNIVTIDVVQDDTRYADRYFKKEYFCAIIGDLPYGVQHGSPTNQGSLTRNPKKLVKDALPAWIKLLRPGGVIALSWNVRILPRPQLEKIVADSGLKVLHSEPLDNLEHVVDSSITRDLLIAKKE
ncbi:TRM11 family SAM-dependent methyltransferase [Anoxybacter fermentans]|uniref:TRM11 family SAM-dependent methyltransferase n=1 Tax=Anoxybacter fermentans TaxID=1323375 RepID=UPI000F8C6923|nr:SAM-dependent methyltransferase [Anoxybacter fermentans]